MIQPITREEGNDETRRKGNSVKRFWTRLVPLLVPACMVDTPVVEGPDDRLGEGLEAWCESTCELLTECGLNEGDDCVESCVEYFEDSFAGKGEACEAAAHRVMDCIDEATCREFELEDACNVNAEASRCAAASGRIVCDTPDSSSGGGGGTAGSGIPSPCIVQYSECSDDNVYEASCEGSDPRDCSCMVNGEVRGRYAPLGNDCPPEFEAKRICGWPIRDASDNPGDPFPVSCGISSGDSTGVSGECEILFDDCADGNVYGAACSGPVGDVICSCTINGIEVASPRVPITICPYALENDGGVAAVNYACNFTLSSVIPL